MHLEYTDFETFIWRRYRIDLKGFTEDQLTDIKIQFALTFISAPEIEPIGFNTWVNAQVNPSWYRDPTKVIKLQYKKYMPISNTRIPVHPNKFKRIFKTKRHV